MPVYTAVDKNGNIVDIEDADIKEEYFCPVCHAPLIIKDGWLNATHFAHKAGSCTDDWHYDMSEWHRRMQSYFPKKAREVVVTNKGKTHRADVLIGKTVIEFQHSPISADEFADRNYFFASLGYRIAWVFDVSEYYQGGNGSLYYPDEFDTKKMAWKNPLRVFSVGKKPSDYDWEYAVWLYLGRDDEDDEDDYIRKVIWCAENDYGQPSFKRLVIRDVGITLNRSFEIEDFFISQKGRIERALKRFSQTHKYTIKYSGIKGKERDAYICPRTNQFGLNVYGGSGCAYCRYCYLILRKKRTDEKTLLEVYCCYPEQLWEVHPIDGEYESGDVELVDI